MKGSFAYLKANKILKHTQKMLDLLKDEKLDEVLLMEELFNQYYELLFIELNDYFNDLS